MGGASGGRENGRLRRIGGARRSAVLAGGTLISGDKDGGLGGT